MNDVEHQRLVTLLDGLACNNTACQEAIQFKTCVNSLPTLLVCDEQGFLTLM